MTELPRIVVASAGVGVQSTVMILKGFRGDFGRVPDCVIFADTKWESPATYERLEWLEKQLPIPIIRVDSGGSLLEDVKNKVRGGLEIPVHLVGKNGERGIARRKCTLMYKVRPIRRGIRQFLGLNAYEAPPAGTAEMWLGISVDEAIRMKPSPVAWVTHRWPLIEARMSRADCHQWFKENYPELSLERSACMGCPFQSRKRWVEIKRRWPEHFADLVAVDAGLREGDMNLINTPYLHPARLPLAEAVELDQMQVAMDLGDGFGNECEGHCGV